MAASADIEQYFSGNDVRLLFTAIDEDTQLPLNLSGAQALEWKLAKKATSSALIEKSLGNGVTITDPSGGLFEVAIDAEDTEALKGDHYHEVRLTNSSGKKVTLAYGVFPITVNLVRD